MKKTIKRLLVLTVLATLLVPSTLHAEDSTATITISGGQGSAPTFKPDTPTDQRLPGETGELPTNNPIIDNSQNANGLTLDTVPSFPFGTIQVGGIKTVSTTYTTPYVQVSDRRGTSAGWHLTVKTGPMTLENSTITIPYTLKMFKGAIVPGGTTSTTNPPVYAVPVTSEESTKYSSYTEASTTATALLNAPVGKGAGAWITRLYGSESTEKTQLIIDTTNVSTGNYSAKITWGIVVGPAGS